MPVLLVIRIISFRLSRLPKLSVQMLFTEAPDHLAVKIHRSSSGITFTKSQRKRSAKAETAKKEDISPLALFECLPT